jgi:hypothetical protein
LGEFIASYKLKAKYHVEGKIKKMCGWLLDLHLAQLEILDYIATLNWNVNWLQAFESIITSVTPL